MPILEILIATVIHGILFKLVVRSVGRTDPTLGACFAMGFLGAFLRVSLGALEVHPWTLAGVGLVADGVLVAVVGGASAFQAALAAVGVRVFAFVASLFIGFAGLGAIGTLATVL